MSQPTMDNQAVERFIHWFKERHQIHIRRLRGEPKPWTNDRVLQNTFFTNPYREHDKTTVWFRENIRDPLSEDPAVVFATILFRWLNYIPTGRLLIEGLAPKPLDGHYQRTDLDPYANRLYGPEYNADHLHDDACLLTNWEPERCRQALWEMHRIHGKVFTGAYMIKILNATPKIDALVQVVDNVWREREALYEYLMKPLRAEPAEGYVHTLRRAWLRIKTFSYLGPFMAYEVVTDLRHTHVLRDALDIKKWANPGPGCARGLCRLCGLPPQKVFPGGDVLPLMEVLLDKVKKSLPLPKMMMIPGLGPFTRYPAPEMREIEHSLCEFDKYERARLGDGRIKRGYNGTG